jgi:ferritin-like metal-binding protein YciE
MVDSSARLGLAPVLLKCGVVKTPTLTPTDASPPPKPAAVRKPTKHRKKKIRSRSQKRPSSPLQRIFLSELADMLHAEKQLVKALPLLARAVHDPELKQALSDHGKATREQVKRGERVFKVLGKSVPHRPCVGMRGIIGEARKALHGAPSASRDALIVASAQKAEHYEIATYGTLVAWAKTLRQDNIVQLLETTLREEESTDALLTRISEARLNSDAADNKTNKTKQQQRTDMPRDNKPIWENSPRHHRSTGDQGDYDSERYFEEGREGEGRRYVPEDDEDIDSPNSGSGRHHRDYEQEAQDPRYERFGDRDRPTFRTEYDENRRSFPRVESSNSEREDDWDRDPQQDRDDDGRSPSRSRYSAYREEGDDRYSDHEMNRGSSGSRSSSGSRDRDQYDRFESQNQGRSSSSYPSDRRSSARSSGSASERDRGNQGGYPRENRGSSSSRQGFQTGQTGRGGYSQPSNGGRFQGESRSSADRTYESRRSSDDDSRGSSRSSANRSSRDQDEQGRYARDRESNAGNRSRSSSRDDTGTANREMSRRRTGVITAGDHRSERDDQGRFRAQPGSSSAKDRGERSHYDDDDDQRTGSNRRSSSYSESN